MEIGVENECGLCSKVSAQPVRIATCRHIYCTLCLLDYLRKRRFCPICVPKKKKAGFLGRYLTYIHPIKLIKKIKKHNKRIARRHLIPVTERPTNQHTNRAVGLESPIETLINGQFGGPTPLRDHKFTLITVEKEPLQRTANESATDLNNNLNQNNCLNSNLSSDELKDLQKYEKIRELIVKNERLRDFIEKIGKLRQTMSSFQQLNEINKLISDLSQNQLELKNEAILLKKQVDELNALNSRYSRLIETRNEQGLLQQRADSVNQKLHSLIQDYRAQNAELKQNHQRLANRLTQAGLAA